MTLPKWRVQTSTLWTAIPAVDTIIPNFFDNVTSLKNEVCKITTKWGGQCPLSTPIHVIRLNNDMEDTWNTDDTEDMDDTRNGSQGLVLAIVVVIFIFFILVLILSTGMPLFIRLKA